jgi:hypothetical protein
MSSNCLKGEVALTDTHHPEFWAKAINLRSLILLGLTSCLGGCAAGQIIQNIPDAPLAGDLTEPNYRQIIAENLAIVFPNPVPLGMLEISGLRRIDHLKGPAWISSEAAVTLPPIFSPLSDHVGGCWRRG